MKTFSVSDTENVIRSTVRMISGCMDSQTSADVSNVSQFQLPDPAGRSGGACTSAFLRIMYNEQQRPSYDLTFAEVLMGMRDVLSNGSYSQIPQLTSSHALDINEPFQLHSLNSFRGKKRALLIGINYVGQSGELSGCHNDVWNIRSYLIDVHGFEERYITILMDDGLHTSPTRKNIMSAFRMLVKSSVDGDSAFCHFSGE